MGRNKKYILIISLCLIGLLVYRYLTYPFGLSSSDFKSIYESGDVANEQDYLKQCEIEINSNLSFPLGQVKKAVVCNGFFSFDRELSKNNTERLIVILNDTASYVWGEVGTFIPDKQIIFYDKENKPLGITEFEEEGGKHTYSYPYLKRTKWGALTEIAYKEIIELIGE